MFRHEFIKTIHDIKIPHSQIAVCAGVVPARISDYVRNRSLTTRVAARIEEAVEKMAYVLSTFRQYSPELKIVLDNPQTLDQMVDACEKVRASIAEEQQKQIAEYQEQTREGLHQMTAQG